MPRDNCRKALKHIFDTFQQFLTRPLSAGTFCGPLFQGIQGNFGESKGISANVRELRELTLGNSTCHVLPSNSEASLEVGGLFALAFF